jgi:PAS domain S-box-containing protein
MSTAPTRQPAEHSRPGPRAGFERVILRLVKGGPERRAIDAGEIDAIVDPDSGRAMLLPEAQRAVMVGKTLLQSLVALCSDWSWEQDEQYRFTLLTGTAPGYISSEHNYLLGKTLWELPVDNMTKSDWQMFRNRLDWRASFRDIELRHVDANGEMRWLSLNGEPIFDGQGQFKGYRGTTRDVTARKRAEAVAEGANRNARAVLDALAAEICMLDPVGTVILANDAWRACGPTQGIAAGVPTGGNYLAVCEHAAGEQWAHGRAMAAGIRRVIAGTAGRFEYRFPGHPASGMRAFSLAVTGYHGDGVGCAVVSRTEPARPVADPPSAPRVGPAGATRITLR